MSARTTFITRLGARRLCGAFIGRCSAVGVVIRARGRGTRVLECVLPHTLAQLPHTLAQPPSAGEPFFAATPTSS